MKAILIDPHARTVTEVEHDGTPGSLLMFTRTSFITMIAVSRVGDALILDDIGLLRDLSKQAFFHINTYEAPLAGYGLIIGTDEEGEDAPTTLTVTEVASRVRWLTREEAGV